MSQPTTPRSGRPEPALRPRPPWQRLALAAFGLIAGAVLYLTFASTPALACTADLCHSGTQVTYGPGVPSPAQQASTAAMDSAEAAHQAAINTVTGTTGTTSSSGHVPSDAVPQTPPSKPKAPKTYKYTANPSAANTRGAGPGGTAYDTKHPGSQWVTTYCHADGSCGWPYPDSSMTFCHADGSCGWSWPDQPDKTTYSGNGTRTTYNPNDQVTTTVTRDGTTSFAAPGGTTATYHTDGSVLVTGPGGSTTAYRTDGSVVVTGPGGTLTQYKNGTTYEAGPPSAPVDPWKDPLGAFKSWSQSQSQRGQAAARQLADSFTGPTPTTGASPQDIALWAARKTLANGYVLATDYQAGLNDNVVGTVTGTLSQAANLACAGGAPCLPGNTQSAAWKNLWNSATASAQAGRSAKLTNLDALLRPYGINASQLYNTYINQPGVTNPGVTYATNTGDALATTPIQAINRGQPGYALGDITGTAVTTLAPFAGETGLFATGAKTLDTAGLLSDTATTAAPAAADTKALIPASAAQASGIPEIQILGDGSVHVVPASKIIESTLATTSGEAADNATAATAATKPLVPADAAPGAGHTPTPTTGSVTPSAPATVIPAETTTAPGGPGVTGPAADPATPSWITPGSLPPAEQAALNQTVNNIDAGTIPAGPTAKKWGTQYKNWPGPSGQPELPGPSGSSSPYKEYRVAPPPGTGSPGPLRVVANPTNGEIYYTWTHYGDKGRPSFVRIR